MDLKKHFFMTFSALFFLGIIVAKPGSAFHQSKERDECKPLKGKMECQKRVSEYPAIRKVIEYRYE